VPLPLGVRERHIVSKDIRLRISRMGCLASILISVLLSIVLTVILNFVI
jgi:hypothetical protein